MLEKDKIGEENLPPETNLIELSHYIWKERKFIFKILGISVIVGLIIAFSIPKEYEVTVLLAPETNSSSNLSGGLGSLAAMAGVSLGGVTNEDAIYPTLYPKIVSSTPFLVDLFNVRVVSEQESIDTTLYVYLKEYQNQAWWGKVLSVPGKLILLGKNFFKEKEEENDEEFNYFNLSGEQTKIAENINNRINVFVDKKTGVISLTIKMQDPMIAATIADSVKNSLQEYITTYRTNKARQDLLFAEKLYAEAREGYITAQRAYADFTDGNMNIVLAKYKAELDRLENEMNLSYNIYSQVAQQLQLSKAKVQEITPVYTVLQPSTVPLLAVSPQKKIILLLFIVLGVIISVSLILFKDKVKSLKNALQN